MNEDDLSTACPGIDFNLLCSPYDRTFTIGKYVVQHLPTTFNMINSSPNIDNHMLMGFVDAKIKDHHLPFTKEFLIKNLQCSDVFANDFLLTQSSHFAVSFDPQEYKILGPLDFAPFKVDTRTKPREGGYGNVEKVFEGITPFARKTIKDNCNPEHVMMEIKVLELATATRNPHLLQLRCAYEKDNRTCLVMHPWCDLDLSTFLNKAPTIPWWTQREPEEKLILITDWMACLASGLSALHRKNIKHQDMKPQNILLDADMRPVICDFGLSKVFVNDSKSVKFQGTLAYMPPEQGRDKVGRKGDIFSLGVVFVELGLLFYGVRSWKDVFPYGFYSDVTNNLVHYLQEAFPLQDHRSLDDWREQFLELITIMLDVAPENRPTASTVWKKSKEMVESLGATPHCEAVSPMGSITLEFDDDEVDTELPIRESHAKCMAKKIVDSK